MTRSIPRADQRRRIGQRSSVDALVRPNFSVYGHYLNGLGPVYREVGARPDRPFVRESSSGRTTSPGRHDVVLHRDHVDAGQGCLRHPPLHLAFGLGQRHSRRHHRDDAARANLSSGVINPRSSARTICPTPGATPSFNAFSKASSGPGGGSGVWEANKMSSSNGDGRSRSHRLRATPTSLETSSCSTTLLPKRVTVTWEVRVDSRPPCRHRREPSSWTFLLARWCRDLSPCIRLPPETDSTSCCAPKRPERWCSKTAPSCSCSTERTAGPRFQTKPARGPELGLISRRW